MDFETLKLPGRDAMRLLNDHRSLYAATGKYPFLIGDVEELARMTEAAGFNEQEPSEVIRRSFDVDTAAWAATKREEAEEYEFSFGEALGKWPGEIAEKGSFSLHKKVLSGKIK